ncbi:MAG: penicillin-binding protein activator [SAR324 cluster bacterium]|nr:penicillin-binding protein activator [SAR324 cluster bacterium]
MNPRRTAAALGSSVLLLAWVPAAGAQSLLSMPPQEWTTVVAAGDAGARYLAQLPEPPSLFALLDMVERGAGRAAYPLLLERFHEPSPAILLGRWYWRDVRRRHIAALLRAGEGIAAPEAQEEAAHVFVDEFPDDPYFSTAFFFLNQALYRQGLPLEESFFFDDAALESLPPWMQSRYPIMQAESAERRGDFAVAAAYRLSEMERATGLRQSTRAQVLELLGRLPGPEALEAFLARYPETEWIASEIPLLHTKALINAGRLDEAYLALERIARSGSGLSGAQVKALRDTRTEVERAVLTQPRRIGVLLPLSSSNAALRSLARDTLDGLRMAVQFARPPESARVRLGDLVGRDLDPGTEGHGPNGTGAGFELVIKDTANRSARAARMVEELVRRDRVIAIVGPVARSESVSAMQRAEELGVPILTLSITAAIPPDARFSFRHNKSQEQEVRDLVRYAMDYLSVRRFAILFPRNKYGEAMRELLWSEVAANGGEVVAISSFLAATSANEAEVAVGMKAIFENLAGIDRFVLPEDRALIDAAEDDHPDPRIQFDALFIPIHAGGEQALRVIAPYPATVDAEVKVLLGTRNWNSEGVLVAGAGKLNGAVFVDSYHRESIHENNQAFRVRHRYLFRHRPDYRAPSFFTALGYDSLAILTGLLVDPKIRTRERLTRAIADMAPFAGLTGLTSFIGSGYAVKESMILRIAGNRIVTVFP